MLARVSTKIGHSLLRPHHNFLGGLPSAARLGGLPRTLSSAVLEEESEAAWESSFLQATENVSGSQSHWESAEALRTLVTTGILRHTDLRDRPARFFKAHRLLARHAVEHGPGFWIRCARAIPLYSGSSRTTTSFSES